MDNHGFIMTEEFHLDPSRTSVLAGEDTYYLSRGDTTSPISATLHLGGERYDLSDARRVRFLLWNNEGTVIDKRAEIVEGEQGRVRYEWSRGETSDLDSYVYRACFKVVASDGSELTFPNVGSFAVKVD